MTKKTNCEHPERKPEKGDCSKELKEKCHGKDTDCEYPERKPEKGDCSKELKEKCHGKS